jgi:hypothetical protein
MSPDQNKLPMNPHPAQTGNASNPSPRQQSEPTGNQLLDEKAEKYLREGGNIEDLPDSEEEEPQNSSGRLRD